MENLSKICRPFEIAAPSERYYLKMGSKFMDIVCLKPAHCSLKATFWIPGLPDGSIVITFVCPLVLLIVCWYVRPSVFERKKERKKRRKDFRGNSLAFRKLCMELGVTTVKK